MIMMMPAHPPGPSAQQPRGGQVNDLLPLGDWIRHHSLRSWPVMLFLLLICVPSIALVILGGNPSASTLVLLSMLKPSGTCARVLKKSPCPCVST